MPHILLESDVDIILDTQFNFIATSSYDQKIGVSLDNKEFLLTKIKKDSNTLIKLDNATRLTPVSLMKKALKNFAEKSSKKILFSNIESKYNKVEPTKQYLKDINYFANEFNTTKEICIEVGFGSGVHLIHQAKNNPDKIYIGLEIHYPSIEQVLKQCKLQNITNILIINYDARLFLEFLKSNSVSRIFVHFPVPWDKKPHRRVMSHEFITESLRVLRINGTLELRTDSINYYEYNLELLKEFQDYPIAIRENEDVDITSKYEARWKKQEKTIWDITIKSTKNNDNIELEGDFSFDDCYDISKIKDNLNTTPIIKNDFLVHFETIYSMDDRLLLKVTLGSFNKPVTKYIIVAYDNARYFSSNPIKTRSNLNAHNLIKELLK